MLSAYERVTFERPHVDVAGEPRADLVAPGHPLLDAVVSLTIEKNRSTLKHGAVLIDADDVSEDPRLLVAMTQSVVDGHDPSHSVSKRFDFVEITPDGVATGTGQAPYLDYTPSNDEQKDLVRAELKESWGTSDPDDVRSPGQYRTRYRSTLRRFKVR